MNYKEKAQILRSCSGVNGHTCSSCPAFGKGNRTCRSNAMKDGAICIEMLLERAESAELRAEKAEKIVDEYAESARAIALWLSGFCDKSLSYPNMISNAARKISVAYADMEKRAEKAEKELSEMREAWEMYGGEDGITAAFKKAEDLHRQLEELKKRYGGVLYSI